MMYHRTNLNCFFRILLLNLIGICAQLQVGNAQITDTLSAKTQVEQANKLVNEGSLTEAVILFKKAISFYRNAPFWEQYFETHLNLSNCYLELAQYEEAALSADTLIHQSKIKLKDSIPFVINGYMMRGNINFKLSNLEETEVAFRKAFELSLQTYGEQHILTADSYGKMGTLAEQLGDDQMALEYNLKALDIRKKLLDNNHLDLAYSYSNIGLIYNNRGDLKKGLSYTLKALTIFEANLGTMHPKMGILKSNIGRTYSKMDNNGLAVQYYKESLAILTKALGPEHANIGLIKTNIAMVHLAEDQYKDAEIQLNEARDIWLKSLPEDHYYLAVYHNNISLIKALDGNYEAALESMEKGIEIYKKRLGPNNPELATFYNNVSIFSTQLKKYDQALAACDTSFALNVLQANNGVLSFKDPCFNPIEYLRAYAAKTKIFSDQFDKTHDIKFAQKALEVLDEAEKTINERNKLYTSEDDLIFNDATFYTCLRQATSLHFKIYQLFNNQENLEQAFRFAEKSKAKTLLQSTNVINPELYARVPADIIQEERQTRTNITAYESEVLNFALAGDSTNLVEYRDQKLFNEKLKLDSLIDLMRTQYPSYHNMKYATDVATIDAIQPTIPDETLLISYSIDNKQYDEFQLVRTPKVHIFTIGKNSSNVKSVDWSMKDDSLAHEFHTLIQKSSIVKTKNKRRFIELSNHLYQKLLDPITTELKGNKRLVIIGESSINYIPFEALLQNKENQSFKNLDYLIKDYDISYHYSATLYLKSLQKRQDLNDLNLLAFAPVFDDPTKNTIPSNQQRYFQDSTYSFMRDNRYQPLLWSEKEVLAIHELFQSQTKKRNKLLLRNNASESALKQYINQHNGIVHIASHSFANLKTPKFSGIACAVKQGDAKEDGILHVNEIYNIQLNADLVVLSSCESGFGLIRQGEGMLGINRSFLYSGANNVLYSLWKVNDKASSELMVEFYKQFFKTKNYATSLRASKLKLISDEATALPNYWAPFVLIGR